MTITAAFRGLFPPKSAHFSRDNFFFVLPVLAGKSHTVFVCGISMPMIA
jgi:hypothetical protein